MSSMHSKDFDNSNPDFIGPFLPVLGAFVWGGLFWIYYNWLDMGSVTSIATSANPSTNSTIWQRDKLLFGASSFALSIALLWNIVVAGSIMRKHLRGHPSMTSNIIGAAMLSFYGLAWFFLRGYGAGGAAADELLQTLAKTGAPVLEMTRIANLLAATAIVFIVGSVATLQLPRKDRALNGEGERIQAYTLSIYSTGVLLGFGIFEIFSLYSWAANTSTTPKDASILALAKTLPLCAGIVFSLLMVLIYLPVALRQHSWLKIQFAKATKIPPDISLDNWLNQQGLPGSPLNIFGSYMAMLLPFGTGMVTKLLGA